MQPAQESVGGTLTRWSPYVGPFALESLVASIYVTKQARVAPCVCTGCGSAIVTVSMSRARSGENLDIGLCWHLSRCSWVVKGVKVYAKQAGVTAELIWPLRVAGPVLRGLRSPAALAE
jgi:hypothetical protein